MDGSSSLSGTLRWVMTQTLSLPLIAMDVCPELVIALKAYSVELHMLQCQRNARIMSGFELRDAHRLGKGDLQVRRELCRQEEVRLCIEDSKGLRGNGLM